MATYAKLKNGNWGVRARGQLVPGSQVQVATKAGAIKSETIMRVVWTGPDRITGETISLCTIVPPARRHPQARLKCGCTCPDCRNGCQCEAHCICRGGNIYDC